MARQFKYGDSSFWQERQGDGSDGDVVFSSTQTYSVARNVATGSSGSQTLSAPGNSGFNNNYAVLIHQSQFTGVGAWELNVITSVTPSSFTLKYPLQNNYTTGAQVYHLRQYNNVTVNSGVVLSAPAWDGSTGGILAFLVAATLNVVGSLNASAAGYRGGFRRDVSGNSGEGYNGFTMYAQPNGNGGGGGQKNESGSTGGAGGGNGSVGDNAFQKQVSAPVGGTVSGSADLTTMTFGGGGGMGGDGWQGGNNGAGGYGGGIIFVMGRVINITGFLSSNGTNGNDYEAGHQKAAAGGGGAGGSILIKGQTVTLGTSSAAAGGFGGFGKSDSLTYWGGPGGNGGTGRISIYYSNTYSGSSVPSFTTTFDSIMADAPPSSVKADIKVTTRNDVNTKASIVVIGGTAGRNVNSNSVKANKILQRAILDTSVRASLRGGTYFKKRYSYRMYYSNTDIRDVWGNEVTSEPAFRMQINSGPGEVIVQLARKFDAFGEGEDIVLNRKIDIYVHDKDAPNGRLLYQGYISGYAPILDGANEYVEITILGYVVEIGQRILKDSSGNTTLNYLSSDPSGIMKDVINKYRADGGNLTYTANSIDMTGTTVTYQFSLNTIKEVFDKIIELTPYDWYWRIDPDGVVYLKQRGTLPLHQFYIGRHIIYMRPERRIESLRNVLYFVGGTPEGSPQLFRKYTHSSSVAAYGLREETVTDQRVTLTTTADTKAARILAESDQPETRTVIRIADNAGEDENKGYDIESIKPGDTISIENLKSSVKALSLWDRMVWDSSKWDYEVSLITAEVLHVITVSYTSQYVEIEAARALPTVAKRIEDLERNLSDLTSSDLPVAPVNG